VKTGRVVPRSYPYRRIAAPLNVPSLLGEDASELYAKNQYRLLALMLKGQHYQDRLGRRHSQKKPP
jgi:NAD/NADP transhydrogenase alpha subunit